VHKWTQGWETMGIGGRLGEMGGDLGEGSKLLKLLLLRKPSTYVLGEKERTQGATLRLR
jgi:hypothetical protein